jgi:hypothetical protein
VKRSDIKRGTSELRRIEMPRATKGLTRTRTRPKPFVEDPELTAARKIVVARSGGRCEVQGPTCAHIGRHVHHTRRPRHLYHAPEWLLHVCHSCHAYIHAHPALAYDQGWLLRSSALESQP